MTAAKKKKTSQKLTYKDAGVDIDVGNALADDYLKHIKSTLGPQVVRNDGGFAGLYRLLGAPGVASKGSDPLLVSATDGVGTKLKIAFAMDQHDTVGIDLVAMSANDILVQGATPLFFLDYIATGKAEGRIQGEIVKGIAEGCRQAGCALLGGETAEHPGDFPKGEYDLAGFVVGVVEKKQVITGKSIRPGDAILGIQSSGLHSNGYSLARKALLDVGRLSLEDHIDELGCTLGEEMLRPTRIYIQDIQAVQAHETKGKLIKGLVHITGGGLYENIPRILPKNCDAQIYSRNWKIPPIFSLIAKTGNVARKEMFRVFNMGIGMTLFTSQRNKTRVLRLLSESGCNACEIGEVVEGNGKVCLKR